MKIDDIITLSKAGFTKDEIIQLVTGLASEEPETTQSATEPVNDKTNDGLKPGTQEPEPVKEDPRIDKVISKLEELTSGMENFALKNTTMPERETAEDALARIINPYLTTGTGGIENGSK